MLQISKIVTGAVVVRLATAAAGLAIVENTHTGIEQAPDTGLISIVGSGIRDLNDRALLDLVGTEDAKLNANDGLDI